LNNRRAKIFASFIAVVILMFLVSTIKVMSMPGNIKITDGSGNLTNLGSGNIKSNIIYKVDSGKEQNKISKKHESGKFHISIKLFGVVPVKKMTVSLMPEVKVIPGGQPIGVKLFTQGSIVVGFSDVEGIEGKKQSPAATAGIEIGDSITEINNEKITNTKHLASLVNKNGDKLMNVKISRKGKEVNLDIKPIPAKGKSDYKIGLWVRDSTAGVGTLTFLETSSGKFGALGHPINDVDTGILLPVRDGRVYNAKIISVEQGMKGKPGELRGIFSEDDDCGKLEKNSFTGIYGKMESLSRNNTEQSIPIGRQNEVKEGPAKILTCVDGSTTKEYDIYIEKLTQQSKPNSKSMIIRVTDEELLAKTGGIVQGMSGSPIIQDNKLVGAVTHVFVNRPDMGYGIYIEWMLKEAGIDI
jgi:stage IV sporulation protein B